MVRNRMTDVPIIIAGTRHEQALRAQLADVLALNRPDASPAQLARLYATCVTAYRAANLRARVVAQVPYRVVTKSTSEPLEDHPLNALFRDNLRLPSLIERSEVTECFWGHNLLYKQRMLSGRVTGLAWVNPKRYDANVSPTQGLVDFRFYQQIEEDEIPAGAVPPADVVYHHGIDFDDDHDGVSPAENAFDMAGIEVEAAQTAVWFLRNRAVPAALLQPKDNGADTTPPTDAAVKGMRRLINVILQGSRNAGKTIVTRGRWEWEVIQSSMDKVLLAEQVQFAREGVSMAFDVPLDLLLPTAATFAELYQSNQNWVEYFAKARCKAYATEFNIQLVPEFGDDIKLEPDFAAVFKGDENQLTDVADKQLKAGVITIYDAQIKTQQPEPDEDLKDIYIIGGTPMSKERLLDIAQNGRTPPMLLSSGNNANTDGDQDGNEPPSPNDDGDQPPDPPAPSDDDDEQKLPPQASRSALSGNGFQIDTPDWLPDDVFQELRTCTRVVARRGAAYDFEPDVLPVDVVAYVRALAVLNDDSDDLLTAARSYWFDTADLRAMRAYADVEAAYRAALFNIIREAFAQQLDRASMGARGHAEIDHSFERAFLEGLRDSGVNTGLLEPGEIAYVREQALAERGYWSNLADTVFDTILKLSEELNRKRSELAAATDPDEQERLRAELLEIKQKRIAERDRVLNRLTLWAQGLRRIYSQGQLSGKRNAMMKWVLDDAKENCRSCFYLNGQVHRASSFQARDLYPGSSQLECVASAKGVPVCGCGMVATDEPATGRLARVPTFGAKSESLGLLGMRAEYGQPDGCALFYLENADEIIGLQNRLIEETPALDEVRWVPMDYLHLTLVYSDFVTDDALQDIFTAVMADGVPQFTLNAVRLDTFEGDGETRPVVLFIEPDDALRAFQRRVYEEFVARDLPVSEYSQPENWHPHITLAYERVTGEFVPETVAVTCHTGDLVFSRGDFVTEHVAGPGMMLPQGQEVSEA